MNCAEPTDVTFSFTGFAARGGVTDHHADGWGIAFFEDKACRLFIDHQSSASSPLAEMVKRYPIKSKNTIAHIRKATQGHILLENCHPFMRELWGRHWIFAHNGDLKDYAPEFNGVYQPVGTTDSELAFCALLQGLRDAFPGAQPPLDELFDALETVLTRDITQFGVFNFLMSNGQALFSHCSTHLLLPRAELAVLDRASDRCRHVDRLRQIHDAGRPRRGDRNLAAHRRRIWTAFEPGDLAMFQQGALQRTVNIPVPEDVAKKAAVPLCKVCVESALKIETAAVETALGIERTESPRTRASLTSKTSKEGPCQKIRHR